MVAVVLVFLLAPVNPCTGFGPGDLGVKYLSVYCLACCRGPVMLGELFIATLVTSTAYVVSWFAGWWLDNYFYHHVEDTREVTEQILEKMVSNRRYRSTRSFSHIT